jgi:UDP-glucose 4-epimerase
VTKLAVEHHTRVFASLFDVETIALRYFNVFGPRQRSDSQYAAVIPLFIDALRNGRTVEIHGDGLQSRDFTFIDDVVRANVAAGASSASGIAVNVAGGQPHTILETYRAIAAAMGVEREPVHVADRAGDIKASWADATLAREAIGWSAEVPFEVGIARTVEWFHQHAE